MHQQFLEKQIRRRDSGKLKQYSPSVAWGNNGFFILKDGNSVTDQSGNSNNFTVGAGTLTSTKDCPSNVFATWNPLFTIIFGVLKLHGY